jgi:hypothetical protein
MLRGVGRFLVKLACYAVRHIRPPHADERRVAERSRVRALVKNVMTYLGFARWLRSVATQLAAQ